MSSLKHLSKPVSKISGKLFERKFVTLGRLLQHWDVIVGKDLSKVTTPVKVTYQKNGQKKGAKLGLIVSADSSQAMLLHYRKDLILQKINQILGDKTIETIKFVDQSDAIAKSRKSTPVNSRKPLTDPQKKDLSGMLDEIEDEELKQTLERFGKSLMIDGNSNNETPSSKN